jgi:DNA mismatch repair protein MSH3
VDPENPGTIGLTSNFLRGIICSLPRVRPPIKKLLGIVNLKNAAKGKKEMMWNDPERYPAIIDSDMVS